VATAERRECISKDSVTRPRVNWKSTRKLQHCIIRLYTSPVTGSDTALTVDIRV